MPMAEQESTLADTASYDPFTIEPQEQTFERLRKLRATSPVVPLAAGMWYVSRHEEARHVLRDTEHFSNAQGFRAHPWAG
jgi:cytochrome P450